MRRMMVVSVLIFLLCGVASAVDGPKCSLAEALDTDTTVNFITGGGADWLVRMQLRLEISQTINNQGCW